MADVSAGAAVPASETFQAQVEAAETQDAVEQPEVEAAPEAPETPEVDKVEKVVPLGALHEERQRRKELQQEAAQLRQSFAQLQQQQVAMMQYLQSQQQPAPLPPDPNADPFGRSLHDINEVKQSVNGIQQHIQRQDQEQQQAYAVQNFKQYVATQDAQYAAENPEAPAAINFLKSRKVAEYEAAGMSRPQAMDRMLQDEFQLCIAATQRGENPAEVAHRMAKAVGWVAPQAKIDMQANGAKAAAPNGGGGQGGGKLSLDALLKMDGKDFLKATSGDGWKKLMGKQ